MVELTSANLFNIDLFLFVIDTDNYLQIVCNACSA